MQFKSNLSVMGSHAPVRKTSSGFAYASVPSPTILDAPFSAIFIQATAAPRAVAGREESSDAYVSSSARTSAGVHDGLPDADRNGGDCCEER